MGVKNTPSQDHRGGYTRSYIRTPGGIGQALALAGAVTIIAWRESESQAVILLTSVYLVYTDNSATIKTL
jgi:hypothetical protein